MIKLFTKKRKGFTLIELVVVIAILGILAALAIPRLTGARSSAAENADAASARTIQSAIGLAEANGDLDLTAAGLDAEDIKSAIIPKYLAEMPKTQTTGTTGWKVDVTGSAGKYVIKITPDANPTTGWTN